MFIDFRRYRYLTLTGTNTYGGTTTVGSNSTIVADNSQALGVSTAPLSMAGGTLDIQSLSTAYNTTVTATSTIASDLASNGAGTTYTLGTLSIGAQTLDITAGSHVTSGTAGLTFGNTTFSAKRRSV